MLKRLQKENGTWAIKLWKSVSGQKRGKTILPKKSKYTCKSKLKKKKKLKKERKRKEKNNEDIKWWF